MTGITMALGEGPAAVAAAIAPMLEHVDWLLCGAGEGAGAAWDG